MATTEMTTTTTTTTATATTDSGKTALEYGHPPPSPPPNFFVIDLALRLLLLASTVSSLVVLVTSKQTKTFPTNLNPPLIPYVERDAYFKDSPALIYLLVALSVGVLYSIITVLASCFAISKPSPSTKLLFNLIAFDALMAGILASATGTAGSVAYLGLKGNSHVGWTKICNLYGKFCRHIGSSTAVCLVASIILVLLVVLSSYSLYRRSH